MIVYTVTAYRWGDRDGHSYIVGVFKDEPVALRTAVAEEDYRGGKYECEIVERSLDSVGRGRVVRAIPEPKAKA
jgi:hypothetical protein